MDSNPVNEGLKSGRIEATEDVEGHALRSGRLVEDEADVEGHMPRIRFIETPEAGDEDGDDDTEAHMPRIRFIETPEASDKDDDEDDAEGHAARGKA